MAEFLDITKDSKELFKDTKIMETEYASVLNRYPTVFISFADAKGSQNDIVKEIKLQLKNEYDRYSYIFNNLTLFEKAEYEDIINHSLNLSLQTLDNISNVLSFLIEQLEKYYGKRVMLFIDEYDIPFIESYIGGFYDEVGKNLFLIFHNALKTSDSLQYAMLSGTFMVLKEESSFSGLNNIITFGVNSNIYGEYFGFSEEKTKEILNY